MDKLTQLARQREPFLFVISYDTQQSYIKPLKDLDDDIYFKIGGECNYPQASINKPYFLKKYPLSFTLYQKAFF